MKYLVFSIVLVLVGNVFGQNKSGSDETLFQRVDKRHKKQLIEASRKIKIPVLKDAKFKQNEAELRIWMIDNLIIASFIIERKNQQWKARDIVFDNLRGKMKRDDFLKPKSGWENLSQYLKDNNLDFDLQLAPEEENFPIHPDAWYFIIETREGKKYSMYWYIYNTNVEDGKRVQNLCEKISEEFNLKYFICKY